MAEKMKLGDDLISIIVPVYNIEAYVQKCLQSIAAQTYKNIEVIIVDDSSTDKSGVICDDFVSRDRRFEVIHKRANGGPARARNSGIRKASGEYLVFVDGDDTVRKDFVEKLYTAIKKNNSQIAVCGYVSDGVKYASEEGNISGYAATVRLLTEQKNSDIVVWNKMYLASLFKDVRFAESKAYEDNLTTYKYYAAADKVSCILDTLYFYSVREDSLMGRSSIFDALSARLKAAKESQKYFARYNPELKKAAEFSEMLAEFAFIDKALKRELPLKDFYKHRKRALAIAEKMHHNKYVSARVRGYLLLLKPLGGWPYKFFRSLIN